MFSLPRGLLAALTALTLVALTRADDNRIMAANPDELAFLQAQPAVRELLKALPADHRIKPEVCYNWSDGKGKQIPCLVALVPVNAAGQPDGQASYFGAEERLVPWKNGQRQGLEVRYVTEGKERRLVGEVPWENDQIHGTQKVYHRTNGRLQMEVPYIRGQRQGEAKTYDLPGRLVKVTPYVDDKTHGEVIEYYPGTQQAKKIIPFRQGKVNGVVREYFENGTLQHELPARDDRFHGVEKTYDEKGRLVRTRYWLNDEIVSPEQYEAAAKK